MSEHGVRPASVVDTNLFVSGAISPLGAPRRILRAWYDNRFVLLLSDQHYAELTDVFRRPKLIAQFRLSASQVAELFATLELARRVEPIPALPVRLRDPNDAKILAAAIGGDADYLVTGDKDLLEHRDAPWLGRLRIVTATELIIILDEERPGQRVEP